jgi:hypothetical protein
MLQLLKDIDQPNRLDKYTMITWEQLKLLIIDVHMYSNAQSCTVQPFAHIRHSKYTVKKSLPFSRPQPGLIISVQGEFGKSHPGWGRENR